jgi:Domain of unknown function (DUF4383)
MTTHSAGRNPHRIRRPNIGLLAVQGAAVLVGAVLLILGILGFIPGATSHVDKLRPAGPASGAEILGVFGTSLLQNMLFIVTGVAGLILFRTYGRARAYLFFGGLLFLVLWLFGLVGWHLTGANTAGTWLHFGLGFSMVVLAATLAGARVPRGARGEVLIPPEL